MAKGKSYQRYSASFKKMALTKAAEDVVTDARTCDEFGVSGRQLRSWRDEFRLRGDRCQRLTLLSHTLHYYLSPVQSMTQRCGIG
jgi:transposase-like protein